MVRRKLPEFLRPAESDALLSATHKRRDRLMLLIGLGAGLRVSEITKLRIEHVDTSGATLFVSQGKGKKDRYVPMPPWLCDALRTWIGKRRTGWMFPSPRKAGAPITTRAVQYMVERVNKAAELTKNVHPHTLRHSYATSLLRSGADLAEIQQLMGHANLSTTALYLHCDVTRLAPTVSKLAIGVVPMGGVEDESDASFIVQSAAPVKPAPPTPSAPPPSQSHAGEAAALPPAPTLPAGPTLPAAPDAAHRSAPELLPPALAPAELPAVCPESAGP